MFDTYLLVNRCVIIFIALYLYVYLWLHYRIFVIVLFICHLLFISVYLRFPVGKQHQVYLESDNCKYLLPTTPCTRTKPDLVLIYILLVSSSVICGCPDIWLNIHNDIKQSASNKVFKHKIKRHYIIKY